MRRRHRTRWERISALPFDASREPRSGIGRINDPVADVTWNNCVPRLVPKGSVPSEPPARDPFGRVSMVEAARSFARFSDLMRRYGRPEPAKWQTLDLKSFLDSAPEDGATADQARLLRFTIESGLAAAMDERSTQP